MINTKIYKAVYSLSEQLMKAANSNDQAAFDGLFAELQAICVDNEDSDKDHPEQWETINRFVYFSINHYLLPNYVKKPL